MRPPGFREGESYPTIMDVHGGPMGFHGYGFNHKFQVLARHGYAVIYVNPRMSTGYGESFAAECCGHYGEKDYSDLMEALDYAIGKYTFIDSERLGVQGHSYGGFMMNWIVGHTNRFKACVSMASISNWESFFGLSDIGTYWVPWQVGFGKDPWESRDLCSEKAPLTYVDKVETPILLMHPEKDYRCPLDQSEQLFVALKKMGKETELIIFPDEHHLLPVSGKPSHRREWIRHTLRWFDRYLK
jgi:dipeptidyl aminopeptidase/acylaminoacyl peptidase